MKTIPAHLRKYIVEQDYSRYTAEDQAVWRYIMRQLKDFLSKHAHPVYVEGLKKTGIEVDRIPQISVMNEKLQKFGWGAVAVSGFIPPAAFMEFQSLGFLPIACDIRSIDHILYTPAPDIVHEAAGHAPILVDPQFADYLFKYAQVAANAIISHEDLKLYEAIRELSDIKENPASTPEQIARAEKKLNETANSITFISEAGYLSRMNWWTAEYGLIGDLSSPRIFGAGLLSSIGESRSCLKNSVKKIPLTIDCIEYSYDITEPQPQLFVTPDFEQLGRVLEELAERMAFRRGGVYGLQTALKAQTVNTVELDNGLQISGLLQDFVCDPADPHKPAFLKFTGPCQLAEDQSQLKGHGPDYHSQGYSTPIGFIENWQEDKRKEGEMTELHYSSGIVVKGILKSRTHGKAGQLLLLTFDQCTVKWKEKVLFDPAWGVYDLAVAQSIPSVFGGPADRASFVETDDFVAARVPPRPITPEKQKIFAMFDAVRNFRERGAQLDDNGKAFENLTQKYFKELPDQWLIGVELLELAYQLNSQSLRQQLVSHLESLTKKQPKLAPQISDGIRLASMTL